jgi:hypothetical protein
MTIAGDMKCSGCGVPVGDDAEYRMKPPIHSARPLTPEGTQSGNPLGIRVEPYCPKCAEAFDVAQQSCPPEV